jgi:hypothetical protein
MKIVNEPIQIPISQYRSGRIKRERAELKGIIYGTLAMILIAVVVGFVLFFVCEHIRTERHNKIIYDHIKNCPRSVVDYTHGDPTVTYRGKTINVLREGC